MPATETQCPTPGTSQIAHLRWATSGPPAPVAATVGPPVVHPPHRWHAIWDVVWGISYALPNRQVSSLYMCCHCYEHE